MLYQTNKKKDNAMALIKCPECGRKISDKASVYRLRFSNKRIFREGCRRKSKRGK